MSIVNIKEVESKVERDLKERQEKAEQLRHKAQIVANGERGSAACLHTGIEIPAIQFDGKIYSKYGEPLPENWEFRKHLSVKTASLYIAMCIISIFLMAFISDKPW